MRNIWGLRLDKIHKAITLEEVEKICDEWDSLIPVIADHLPDFIIQPKKSWKTFDYFRYTIDLCDYLGIKTLNFVAVDDYAEAGGYYTEELKELQVLYPICVGLTSNNIHWTLPHELAHHFLNEFGCYSQVLCKDFQSFEAYAYFFYRVEFAARCLAPYISKKYYPYSRYPMEQLEEFSLDTQCLYIDVAYDYYYGI